MTATTNENIPFPKLSGYAISEQLYVGSRTVVYRAQTIPERQSVVVKILRQAYPSFNEIVQFRNQYAIAHNLDNEGIVRPISLEPWQNGYALVMEDNGSISLAQYKQSQKLDLGSILKMAIQLAEVLNDLHEKRIIHKDIKPANILIHPETQQIKLIDFSIASLLPKESQEIQNPNILEGTLAYIAPEQTGRMNRGIDYRTDFYSLGVTLYELLAGQLPFPNSDPLELVHAHIAQTPVPPHQIAPSIPPVLSHLVLKLMAKNAEDRYQSAFGLKEDLTRCAREWQERGTMTEFELGQQDLYDPQSNSLRVRFTIPEKLYGRTAEVAQLLAAFDRVAVGTSEMMMVAGFSGIGKTAVINEVHKPITRQRGYFIKGKFDQFNRNIPFSAFVRAFRDLMAQLLADSDAQIAQWRGQILQAIGDNGQVLTEVIPELELIIGEQPAVPELAGSAAQNRFNLVFQKFIEVFARPEHPLVIFLDDLQWADSASLQLMKLLMNDKSYLLLLGAYRDNEVSPAHPLMMAVEELKQTGKTVNTLTLAPLAPQVINQLVAETLRCSLDIALPLAELINGKTQGNPFFTTQFLKALYDDRHLTFQRAPVGSGEAARGYWQCDITHLKTLALSDDVVEFMGQQLRKLSPSNQECLKIAAAIGDRFDLATLAIVLEKTEADVAVTLWEALQEGLILPQSEVYKFYTNYQQEENGAREAQNVTYRFLHDRVQQAAYSLIPKAERGQIHARIGRLLLANIPPEQQEDRIFELVNQLNAGGSFLQDRKEKDRLAELNLMACRKAKTSTAYSASRDYAEAGIMLLGERGWERQYELMLGLHDLAVELAYIGGDYEVLETFSQRVLERTQTLLDRINVYQIQIQARIARFQFAEALTLGLQVLEKLGVGLSISPSPEEIGSAAAELRQVLGDREIESLVDLPLATDAIKIAIVRITKSLYSAAFYANSPCVVTLGILAVKTSIEFGNTVDSAASYAGYGRLAVVVFKDIDSSVKFGNLALTLAEKLNLKSAKPEIIVGLGGALLHRQVHSRETLPLLKEGYAISLEVGNIEYALYIVLTYCCNAFWSNLPLVILEQEMRAYNNPALQASPGWNIQWQCILNLMGFAEDAVVLSGEVFKESEFIARTSEQTNPADFFYFCIYKLFIGYLLGDSKTVNALRHFGSNLSLAEGSVVEPALYFYKSLVILSSLSLTVGLETSDEWQEIEQNQTKLKQFWAHYAPMNHQHKVDLVEAEKCRVLDRKLDAIEFYEKAIAGANTHQYIQEEALSNELAAKFYLAWGKEKIAATYMQEAYYGYARWGAKAKTDDLERRYPTLLYPILHASAQPFNLLDTLATPNSPNLALQTSSSVTRSSSSLNNTLDFAAILKAAQNISSTIELEDLLAQLTKIVLQNAGAERCALILPDLRSASLQTGAGEWRVEAIATLQNTQLDSQPLEGHEELPVRLIQYAKNMREAIAIDDLETNVPVIDPYFNQYRPHSFLVQPILDRGNLVGLLYLENRLTRHAFTKERLLVLNFLCSQAAISLENARLYQKARDYAQQLEQSQLQIVQSEKMASLGNLVAGVAHEINNPVGFLNGSVSNARDYIQDLLSHLELYQECIPNPPTAILDDAQEIDLDFVGQDFPKLLDSMQGAIDRIKSISTSLRTFSRADSENPIAANLHEGLDSTLLILKYRLKADDQRPAIEVVKDYGQIPEIQCFPGQLNQVFMNILANAIDALDDVAQHYSYAELEANPQQITISTALNGEQNAVEIRICDNGMGIPESLQSKIFEHLFTTKGVGKGTGLGLAIARQIVEEKHRGQIEVCSFTAEALPSALGRGTEFCIRLPLSPLTPIPHDKK